MTKKTPAKQDASDALQPSSAQIIDIVTKKPPEAVLSGFSAAADGYLAAAQSESTKLAYAGDIRHFLANGGTIPAIPRQLAEYLTTFAKKHAVATLRRRLVAIHKAHLEISHKSPAMDREVKLVMQGIRRTVGTKQRQVRPFVRDVLLDTLVATDRQKPVKATRDRALLLVGFAGAFRRAELVAIRLEHISHVDAGMEIYLPVSKTDQEQQGRIVFIPYANGERCPVTALAQWLAMAGIEEGYVFRAVSRHDQIAAEGLTAASVARIVKASIKRGGGDAQDFSAHSLRAGYCTQAAMADMPPWQIKLTTGHKSDATLAKYIRPVSRRKISSLL
ncbi:MAG: site-specific integrase [Burkholderiaceae bacterium]|nr:site-specific integrase [Burkholderiaceae bacterium]